MSEALGSQTERKRPTDPLLGTLINGKFKIEKAIARGGMGRIYLGTQEPLGRPVAVKVVKADSVNEEESQFLKRFLLEASILAKLQHPNVVTLFDYGRIENAPNGHEMYFIAMEYLDGETLSDRIRSLGTLTAAETLILTRQIARGLREAHTRGIVHRDLKPSNIIIVPEADGEIVKLVDFGIGKVEREGQDLTRDGILVGTPKYMAPEQFDGNASPASDIYALGLIVFQLLVGEVPFAGNTMAEFMMAKLQQPIPAMRELNPVVDTTELLEELVYAMLARNPVDRPTLEEVFSHLARCEEEVFGSNGARLLSSSGSRSVLTEPLTGPHRPRSVGALKVPYTMVAHAPVLTPQSGVSTITGVTGHTGTMATSTRPPEMPAKRAFPLPALLAIVFAIVSIGGTAIWVARSRMTAATPPPPASVAAPIEVASSFVLHVESNPSGAVISEKGTVLGSTPLDIKIERESVKAGPRTFDVKKDGFSSAVATAKDSETRVEQVVTLAPEAGHPVKSPAQTGTKPAGAAKTAPAAGPSDPEIRLKR